MTIILGKCIFLQRNVTYLGFTVDREGLNSILNKVEAIKAIPTRTNVTQPKSFSGIFKLNNAKGTNTYNIKYILHTYILSA